MGCKGVSQDLPTYLALDFDVDSPVFVPTSTRGGRHCSWWLHLCQQRCAKREQPQAVDSGDGGQLRTRPRRRLASIGGDGRGTLLALATL